MRTFSHKALKRFYDEGSTGGLPGDTVAKLRAMFVVPDRMKDVESLKAWPLWKETLLPRGGERNPQREP
jgi:hypothetical protein